jgi:hypothetical protein
MQRLGCRPRYDAAYLLGRPFLEDATEGNRNASRKPGADPAHGSGSIRRCPPVRPGEPAHPRFPGWLDLFWHPKCGMEMRAYRSHTVSFPGGFLGSCGAAANLRTPSFLGALRCVANQPQTAIFTWPEGSNTARKTCYCF